MQRNRMEKLEKLKNELLTMLEKQKCFERTLDVSEKLARWTVMEGKGGIAK